jgi:outer membrane protein assembly factor BamA
MRRALLTPLAVWLCFALPDAKSQDNPPNTNVRISVSSVTLEGTDSIPEFITSEAQQRVMAQAFEKSALAADSTARIQQVFDSYGYLEVVVDPPSVRELATINTGGHFARVVELTFHVVPGPKYSVSGIAVGGTKAIPAQQVRDLIPFHPNDSIDSGKLERALGQIRRVYACSGYLQADPQLYINTHRATQTAFYTIMMKEGEQSTIATVKVLGADRWLVEKLITLPELQPGAVFSSCRIRDAISTNAVLPSQTSSSEVPLDIRFTWAQVANEVDVEIDFSRTVQLKTSSDRAILR